MASFGRNPEKLKEEFSDAVNAERERRLSAGFEFEGNHFDFDEKSKINIAGAGSLAGFAIMSGSHEGDFYWNEEEDPFGWIAASNEKILMDAQTMLRFAKKAAAHEKFHIMKGRKIKELSQIPDDIANDSLWE